MKLATLFRTLTYTAVNSHHRNTNLRSGEMKRVSLILLAVFGLFGQLSAQGIIGIWDRKDSLFNSAISISFDENGEYVISQNRMFIISQLMYELFR